MGVIMGGTTSDMELLRSFNELISSDKGVAGASIKLPIAAGVILLRTLMYPSRTCFFFPTHPPSFLRNIS